MAEQVDPGWVQAGDVRGLLVAVDPLQPALGVIPQQVLPGASLGLAGQHRVEVSEHFLGHRGGVHASGDDRDAEPAVLPRQLIRPGGVVAGKRHADQVR